MKTTINLQPKVLREAKRRASKSQQTLDGYIEAVLRQALQMRKPSSAKRSAKLPTFRSGGTQPGIDLSKSAALYDVLDGAQ